MSSSPATLPHPKTSAQEDGFKAAVALYESGKHAEAADAFRAILKKSPTHNGAWLNLGTALRKMGHHEASLAATTRALELKPDDAGTLTNLGNCLVDLDRLGEALALHEKAMALKPGDFLVRRNYTIALREAGMFQKALPIFEDLLKQKPDDISLGWEKALTHLYLADYKKGWDAFEIRWKLPGMNERVSSKAKKWKGEDLAGKTLLIYEEQGFGDSILCSRYIPLIAARGGKVIMECKKPLHHLFATLPGIVQIGETGQIMSGFDYHIPMMSLPGVFGTDLTNVPPPAPYKTITAPPPEAAKLLALGKGRLKVGIVWSGSTTFANNRKRAVSAERFLPLAAVPGVQLYSLQKGPCEPELKACGGDGLVYELGPHLNDFTETASTLKQLDLVIMTDSAVAHLAGSLGVPVWNLLCYRPYWLYLSDREDCPWYPSMKLFRQSKAGDWDSVFENVKIELGKLAKSTRKIG